MEEERNLLSTDSIQYVAQNSKQKKALDLCHSLYISYHDAHLIQRAMFKSLVQGLSRTGHEKSSVKCIPTYVRHMPTGQEKGQFLALDLGGTNFRILLIELHGSREVKPSISSAKFTIPDGLMEGNGSELFKKIADDLYTFLESRGILDKVLPLAFTFSFPLEQTGLDSGNLIKWTKGYKLTGVIGEDVTNLLHEAIKSRGGYKVDFMAILNDTTGCLLSCAWNEPKCLIGLIVGTGCNACYVEKLDKVELWNGPLEGPPTVIINTEWGAFGEQGELEEVQTKWDRIIDKMTPNPGKQIYEKLISGMYLGEIVRHVLKDLFDKGLLFSNVKCPGLYLKNNLQTKDVCEIEGEAYGSHEKCRNIMKAILKNEDALILDEDCEVIKFVCEAVTRRAAMVLAAGLAALIEKIGTKDVVIAVDGSLFRHHRFFRSTVNRMIQKLVGTEYQIELKDSDDGSGLGAAIVAAVMAGQKKQSYYYGCSTH